MWESEGPITACRNHRVSVGVTVRAQALAIVVLTLYLCVKKQFPLQFLLRLLVLSVLVLALVAHRFVMEKVLALVGVILSVKMLETAALTSSAFVDLQVRLL